MGFFFFLLNRGCLLLSRGGLGSIAGSNGHSNASLALLESVTLGAEALLNITFRASLKLALVNGPLADAIVNSEPLVSNVVGINAGLDVTRELLFVGTVVLLLLQAHVVGNVTAEDVVLEHLGVALALVLGADEALGAVGNVQTTIGSTLDGSEETSTGGGAAETNIEQGLEGTAESTVLIETGRVELSAKISVRGPQLVETELAEVTAGKQEANSVSSGVVGGANGHTMAGELMTVGSAENAITLDGREGQLANNIAVGEADDKTVLGAVVLVLVLNNQTLTGVVVRLSLATSTELGLVTLIVSVVLDDLMESHG